MAAIIYACLVLQLRCGSSFNQIALLIEKMYVSRRILLAFPALYVNTVAI